MEICVHYGSIILRFQRPGKGVVERSGTKKEVQAWLALEAAAYCTVRPLLDKRKKYIVPEARFERVSQCFTLYKLINHPKGFWKSVSQHQKPVSPDIFPDRQLRRLLSCRG